jgi:hypothetical protein
VPPTRLAYLDRRGRRADRRGQVGAAVGKAWLRRRRLDPAWRNRTTAWAINPLLRLRCIDLALDAAFDGRRGLVVDEIGSFESLGTRVNPFQYLMTYPGVRMTLRRLKQQPSKGAVESSKTTKSH